jgi:hypothetical protein
VPAEDLASAQCSGEVRVQDVRPLLFRHGERRHALNFPGTVDKDVDFAETVE